VNRWIEGGGIVIFLIKSSCLLCVSDFGASRARVLVVINLNLYGYMRGV
jgi:hypothetical protein